MNHSITIKPSLLVIDDCVEILEIFKLVFETKGYQVITKKSAIDIFIFVENNKIDILILDIILNGVTSGRRICKELKSNPLTNYFPIILISASPELLFDFRECDADGFIEKPFDLEVAVRKIDSLLKVK
jgi:DNA-binding response OmpR family regulator